MKRRTVLKGSLAGLAGGAIAAPYVAKAERTFRWKMTTT